MISRLELVNEESTTVADSVQRKLLTSKIKGLNDHLAALAQKKIRIDLEIRRTKKKLSKLKTQSSTLVKTRVELEGLSYENFEPHKDTPILLERCGEEIYQELLNLDEQVYRAQEILSTIEEYPLYSD